MKQLIKQIFKSLKSSILLILSLIFLSFCIIFVSSSTLFINQNLTNSLTNLRVEGNSSDIVINKKYNSSDINYIEGLPVEKTIVVSNYEYKLTTKPNPNRLGHLENVIFPYESKDFNGPLINSITTKPVEAPSYFDQYQDRYANRKYGLARGGTAINQIINATNLPAWKGIGFSMTDHSTGEKLFDPKNFIFDTPIANKPPILIGYFNDGSISQEINISESLMQARINNFSYNTNQGIGNFQPLPIHQNVLWHYKLNLNPFLNQYGYYYGDLWNSIVSNTREAKASSYTLRLDKTSLNGINSFIYNEMDKLIIANPTLFSEYKKIISEDFFIRQEWVNDYFTESGGTLPVPTEEQEKIITLFLDNRKKQLSKEFKTFVDNNKDSFIEEYLIRSKYEIGNDSSFTFYDRETKNNYLVSKKEDNLINKIVLNNGIPLINSSEYKKWYTAIYGNLLSKDASNNIDDEMMKNGIKSLVDFFTKGVPSFAMNPSLLASELKILGDAIVVKLTNSSNDPNDPNIVELKWMLKKFFSYFSEPTFFIDSFKNVRINVNFKGNSTVISNRGSISLPILDNYRIMTTQKFIDSSDKEILPLSPSSTDDQNNWEYAKVLSIEEFEKWLDNLDSKYTLQIGIDKFIITGTGLSPEMAYPVNDLINLIPNPKNDILIYANDSAYNSIWTNLGKPFSTEYFTISHNNDFFEIDSFIDKLNSELKPIMNNSTFDVVSRLDVLLSNNNILSIRYSFPSTLVNIVLISSIVLVLVLSLLAIYLFYVVLKKYIDLNKIQLAIIKANGLSTFKISICFSIIALVIAVISGLFAYLSSYFLQPLIFSIFSPYSFIPPIFNSFNFLSFFGGIALIFLIAGLFVFIILHLLFKKPLNLIMSQNIEVKSNIFLNVLKFKNMKISSGNKFKIALFMSNSPRTMFYIFGCMSGISLITISLTLTNKFFTSKYLTDINKDYIFNIDLISPTDQSGLYKTQEYASLGLTDPSVGVTSLYHDTTPGVLPYTKNQLEVKEYVGTDANGVVLTRPKKDLNGNQIYFGNIALPSIEAYNLLRSYPDAMRNAVMVKWLLDFEIPPIIGNQDGPNVWDEIKTSLPVEIISKIDNKDKEFKNKLIATPGIGRLFTTKYATQDPVTKEYKLDGKKIINKGQTVLNQEFLDFIGLVYGDENLSNADAKIAWSIMPIENSNTETYTYVDANIYSRNSSGTSKIYGINPNSKYLNLKNNNEQFIGNKLEAPGNNIIVNNGAALKYKLKIGDTIDIKVNNSYFRYTNKILGLTKIPETFTFKVVDINSTSFGEEFFINQKIANKITYLDQGTFVSKIELINPIIKDVYHTVTTKPQPNYTPYNGYLSNTNDPIYLSKTLSFYSLVNLYGKIGKMSLSDEATSFIISSVSPNFIAEAFLPKSDWIIDQYNEEKKPLQPITRDSFKSEFLKEYNDYQLLINYMNNHFGADVMLLSLSNISNYESSQSVYTTLIDTLDIVQTMIMTLLIPIVIMIIFIMTSIMLNEIRSMISILKTLGYSDKQNISNILFTFIPIFVISTLFSLAVLAVFLVLFQNIVYQFLSIYISASINFLEFLYAVLAIFGMLIINIFFTIYTYKKTKLNTSILS